MGLGLLGGLVAISLHQSITPQPSLPIAILDRGSLLNTLDDTQPESDRAERIRIFESAARHLADAGYLVIDRGWVIAAPEDFYVDLDTRSP
jgi:hypothetical protein